AAFDKLSYTRKREFIRWVTGAKRADTQSRRMEQAIEAVRARPGRRGRFRRPCVAAASRRSGCRAATLPRGPGCSGATLRGCPRARGAARFPPHPAAVERAPRTAGRHPLLSHILLASVLARQY